MKPQIFFIHHRNVTPKYNCNRSGLHLNYSGTNNLIENILYCLCTSDWQTHTDARYEFTWIYINESTSLLTRKTQLRNQKRQTHLLKHSRNYSIWQNKESAKSVLTISSDTPCALFNDLHEQRLNHPKM